MNNSILLILVIIYVFTLVTTIVVLLLENRNPVKSLSWILVLLFIPFLGMVFYLIFGQNQRKRKIINKKSFYQATKKRIKNKLDLKSLSDFPLHNHQVNLIKLLHKNSDANVFANNKIEILSDGESTFEAMFKAIRNAKDHIHVEFFIFGNDRISNEMRELLIEKAHQGVRVRMIYDYLGSILLSRMYVQTLEDAGVYIQPFIPLRIRLGRSKINYRNHRKLLIVDGEVGFTGGLNVADRYIFGNFLGSWRDTFVRFEGDVVHAMQQLFLMDWYFVEGKLITSEKYYPEAVKFSENLVQIVSSGPDTDWESIMQGIASAISSATKYVYIHTPYFIPNDVVETCIQMAALSGVDIRLMVPVRSDSRLSDACSSSYIGHILEAGVKVYRYKEGFLHSKAIVIDDMISIVGSANMDERSFNQNFEVNAFIYDSKTARKLKSLFTNDIKKCEEITLESWSGRNRWKKLNESFARLFSPLM